MGELTIEVTNECCNSCRHCSTQAILDEEAVFLPRRKVREALDRFPSFEKVRFSGGEPFLRPGILNLFKDAKKKGKFVEVLTSGNVCGHHLSDNLIKGCRGIVDSIAFSLYGNPWVHSYVTGECSFNAMDKTVDLVIENKIPFSFNFTAIRPALDGLEDAVRYVSKRKSQVDYCNPNLRVLRFIKQGNGDERYDLALTREEMNIVKDKTLKLSLMYNVDVGFGCSYLEKGCTAGTGKAVLTFDGRYLSCSSLKESDKEGKFACSENW